MKPLAQKQRENLGISSASGATRGIFASNSSLAMLRGTQGAPLELKQAGRTNRES